MIVEKPAKSVDKHVGSRVRMRRQMLAMSQQKLGDALGLTFQQVQKYEKGANRIGAGRLLQIADILKVPVSFFSRKPHQPPMSRTIFRPTWTNSSPVQTDLG
jgi:transcriptional regulator with XRE-family HTH domain